MSKVDLDELEASLGYMDDWYKVLVELRAAREIISALECNVFDEDRTRNLDAAMERYYEVTKNG